jgi:hypothetical protein
MKASVLKQARQVLQGYRGKRATCHKIGMILDANFEYEGSNVKGYVSKQEGLHKEAFYWNNCNVCTQGLWRGRMPNQFSNLQAFVCPSMRDYTYNSTYWCRLSKEDILRFYDILLNHTPYSKLYCVESAEYAYEKGLIVDAKASRNLVIGALMAQRMAWENTKVTRRILHYVDLGVNKTVAFMLGFLFMREGTTSMSSWHVPLSGYSVNMKTIKNFVNGKYAKEGSFSKCMFYSTTIHASWGADGYKPLIEEIAKSSRGATKVIVNPFAKTLDLNSVSEVVSDKDVARYFKKESTLKLLGINHE